MSSNEGVILPISGAHLRVSPDRDLDSRLSPLREEDGRSRRSFGSETIAQRLGLNERGDVSKVCITTTHLSCVMVQYGYIPFFETMVLA
jgi:hypothetical protein